MASDNSTLLGLDEVASRLSVCNRTARRMVLGGALPGYRVGGQWKVKSEDIDAYLHAALRTFARRQGARASA